MFTVPIPSSQFSNFQPKDSSPPNRCPCPDTLWFMWLFKGSTNFFLSDSRWSINKSWSLHSTALVSHSGSQQGLTLPILRGEIHQVHAPTWQIFGLIYIQTRIHLIKLFNCYKPSRTCSIFWLKNDFCKKSTHTTFCRGLTNTPWDPLGGCFRADEPFKDLKSAHRQTTGPKCEARKGSGWGQGAAGCRTSRYIHMHILRVRIFFSFLFFFFNKTSEKSVLLLLKKPQTNNALVF